MEEKILACNEQNKIRYLFLILTIASGAILVFTLADVGLCFNDDIGFWLFPLLLTVVFFVLHRNISCCELVVTTKRVYGTAIFGKRADLPLDSISAVGTSALQGIDVGTSAGSIKFKFISNNAEIHSVISKLLLDRQRAKSNADVHKPVPQSSADELKKFKDLLDSGVITQEEFDKKKKQLLGL